MNEVRVNELGLKRLCEEILVKASVERAAAKTVADVMLYADMRGVESHGINGCRFIRKG